MISALYAALLSCLLLALSFNVIKYRRRYQISTGDGGNEALQRARAAYSNTHEYSVLCLLLLGFAEYNGTGVGVIHLCGLLLFIGRLLHAYAMIKVNFQWRKIGMIMTFLTMIILIITNLVHLPYRLLF